MTYYQASWKGRLRKQFRWRTFRREFGRWCWITNAYGETLKTWWEWE